MILRITLIGTLLLLTPLAFMASGWHWMQGVNSSDFDKLLFFVTSTADPKYAIFSIAILCFLLIKFNKKYNYKVILSICALSMIVTQGIKSTLKHTFKEPRPFITEIIKEYPDFYQHSVKKRQEIVAKTFQSYEFPKLKDKFMQHTDYSFPSGHAIFVSAWVFLFALFLGTKNLAVQTLVFIWATLILISRMRLGMHFPIDLIASIIIAGIVHFIIFHFCLNKISKIKYLQ